MKTTHDITTTEITDTLENAFASLNSYASGKGGRYRLVREAYPVIGGEPDHVAVASMLDLRDLLNAFAKLAEAEVSNLNDIIEIYEEKESI